MPSADVPSQGSHESRLLEALADGEQNLAVTLLLQRYGPEILGFLAALHRSEDDAGEVFSMFAEAVFKSIAAFEHRGSIRAWAYAIARHASLRYRRDARRRDARIRPFADDKALSDVEAKVRTETLSFLRTEKRSKLAALRDALPADDQVLLMLRVDRQLPWNELALVLHDVDEKPLTNEALKRESARLRKRFQTLKEQLREAGRRAGLLGNEGDES
ncbi:MAG: sigma-70 family RNA polymerase sigma factor [Polyangiaceae bacterium]|nr:sigma-70 family RNA polymerase sigma factor [Polyangiaceae bacterium]